MHMATRSNLWIPLLSLCVLSTLTFGCTLKASTESLTDITTNFVSSTTPGAWFNEDGLLNPDQRIQVFVAINYESLQQNMAQGEGEYLRALGTLMNVPPDRMSGFNLWAQEQFRKFLLTPEATPDDFLALLLERKVLGS